MKKLILVGFGLVAMIALADGSEINGWVVAMSVESRPAKNCWENIAECRLSRRHWKRYAIKPTRKGYFQWTL